MPCSPNPLRLPPIPLRAAGCLSSYGSVTLAALIFLAYGSLSAQVVIGTGGSGAGTLRQAITDAAAGATITFDPSLDGKTISLNAVPTTQLLISKNLTIDASSLPNGIIITPNGASRVFEISPGVTAKLDSLTLIGGSPQAPSPALGGCVYNRGSLTMVNCAVEQNSAPDGGAIYSTGFLLLNQSTLLGNSTSFGKSIFA